MDTTTGSFGALSLIINITQTFHLESIVFLCSQLPTSDDGNLIKDLVRKSGTPIIIISYEYADSINIRDNFNNAFLAIVDLRLAFYIDILEKLSELLHFVRQAKTLLILDQSQPTEDVLLEIFRICWMNKMVNVIAIDGDFWETHQLYSFCPYPRIHLETKFSSTDTIYPDRMSDLQGSPIRTLADQIEPRNMMFLHPNGDMGLLGYVGHTMTAFAKKHNARLVYPFPFVIGESTYFAGLRKLLFNDTLDLLVSITIMNVSCEIYSYTLEQNSYCLMLPVEANIPTFKFFAVIMDLSVLAVTCGACLVISILMVVVANKFDKRKKIRIVDIVLNVDCLRGLLSQSFNFLKSSSSTLMFIYLLISILGIYFSTWYLAYLQSFLTHPPTEHPIRSYRDITDAGLKILVYEREFTEVYEMLIENLSPNIFKVTKDYSEFENGIDTMNSSFIYYVPLSKWTVLKGQQQLFSKPLVRLTDMCVMRASQMGFALHEDSIYRTTLNRLIFQIQESGLLQQWMDRSFQELVQIGRMNFSDRSVSHKGFKSLQLDDVYWVFLVFIIAHGLNLLVFVGELLITKKSH